ncbi:winged helix-turn-helix transcriptional regulator [Mycoplasmatota bacterium]|nr:winged helix-turn-helix transcriptional regulator [Mycoplasmatota bacterium]
MAHDIDINTITPKTNCFFSTVVEVISVVQLLAKPNHHQFMSDFTNHLMKSLSNNSLDTLKIIGKFQFHGIELFDVMFSINEYQDINTFIDELLRYSEEEFIYAFTDKSLGFEAIKRLRNNKISIDELEKNLNWMYKETIDEISDVLYHTDSFMMGLSNLLIEIDQSIAFHNLINAHQLNYQDSIDKIKKELHNKSPLEVGQQLMGKTFQNVHDYQEFLFAPSYFISPHRLRVHDNKTNFVIYDLRRDNFYSNKIGEEISNSLKVISDRTRLEILRRLSIGPTYGKLLANSLDLTTATISHHLDLLKSIGMIKEEKIKNIKYFSLNQQKFDEVLDLLKDYINNNI